MFPYFHISDIMSLTQGYEDIKAIKYESTK